ncbi:hypothetical protein CAPTEDRAFT_204247 [Capitella teleta]|uniref:VWFD domain-containing protein n=1 Tax=Capitella teleta TaxID=283909 RepID=R7VKT7_CAPTE|nr:hypothetical protein CAPTEDRAFT_204247 [Capitella teleta]|eukprot:ELU17656.1 hypothetical protein CAPTEDRAFT_204247 [Capitella teleta]
MLIGGSCRHVLLTDGCDSSTAQLTISAEFKRTKTHVQRSFIRRVFINYVMPSDSANKLVEIELGQGGSAAFRVDGNDMWDTSMENTTNYETLSTVAAGLRTTAKYVCVDEIEGWKGKIGESAEIFRLATLNDKLAIYWDGVKSVRIDVSTQPAVCGICGQIGSSALVIGDFDVTQKNLTDCPSKAPSQAKGQETDGVQEFANSWYVKDQGCFPLVKGNVELGGAGATRAEAILGVVDEIPGFSEGGFFPRTYLTDLDTAAFRCNDAARVLRTEFSSISFTFDAS